MSLGRYRIQQDKGHKTIRRIKSLEFCGPYRGSSEEHQIRSRRVCAAASASRVVDSGFSRRLDYGDTESIRCLKSVRRMPIHLDAPRGG
jgi:hypothetical protein